MTSFAVKVYTVVIALVCGALLAWSIDQQHTAATAQTDARAWQRLAAVAVAHDKAITHTNRRLVFRYNRLVHRTAASQRRLIHAVKIANSATTTAASPSTVYQTVSGGTVTAPSTGSATSRRPPRQRLPRAGGHDSNHPHQLMTTLAETRRPGWRWPATGTTWHVHHSGGVSEAAARAVAAAVEKDEARWSRFRPDSDVSRISRAAGTTVEVHPDTVDLLSACRQWTAVTDGVFQPLVCTVLEQWGYALSMAESRPRALEARKAARWWGNSRSTAGT